MISQTKPSPGDFWVSVVIPIHSCRDAIQPALDGLYKQKKLGICEIVFVHDFIRDDTLTVIEAHPITRDWNVIHVRDHPGRGLAQAYNLGWRAAHSPLIIFMHPDCYPVEPNAIQTMAMTLELEHALAVQPMVDIPQGDWDKMSFWDRVTSSQYRHAKPSHNLMGKFDLYRREVLEQLGGFDETRFYSSAEDADMAERLLAIGKIASADVLVIHAHVHPKNAKFTAILRKQIQVGEGTGAMFRKFGLRYAFSRRALPITVLNGLKLFLWIGIFIPPICLYAVALLFLLAIYYGRWAILSRDWRVVLMPFAVAIMFGVYAFAMVRGFLLGKQSFHYEKRK